MTEITLFKSIASKNLPESLYEQLEPHLTSLFKHIDERVLLDQLIEQETQGRLSEAKEAFFESVIPMWPAFAREHWPDIEEFFDLKKTANYFCWFKF